LKFKQPHKEIPLGTLLVLQGPLYNSVQLFLHCDTLREVSEHNA